LKNSTVDDIIPIMSILLVSQMRKAIKDYDMIQHNDCIAVGLSGGKDSLALLYCLTKIRGYIEQPFDIKAVTIKLSDTNPDTDYLKKFCENINVEYIVKQTDIEKIVFESREERSPCSLCANLRRGILNDTAKSLGCNKVALGHNKDDAIETFLMCISYEGRLHTFSPVTYLSRKDITVIRPLIYSWEDEIIQFNDKMGITPVKTLCKAAGVTNRQRIKELIEEEALINPNFKYNLFRSFTKGEISRWHEVK